MNLGNWIETLVALPANAPVKFADGTVPSHLCSWRGSYDELTLNTEGGRHEAKLDAEPPKVRALLKDAKAAVGKTFEGYKGGDYVMRESTPVWADPWGAYRSMGIAGVTLRDGVVTIETVDLGDYR